MSNWIDFRTCLVRYGDKFIELITANKHSLSNKFSTRYLKEPGNVADANLLEADVIYGLSSSVIYGLSSSVWTTVDRCCGRKQSENYIVANILIGFLAITARRANDQRLGLYERSGNYIKKDPEADFDLTIFQRGLRNEVEIIEY